MHLRLTHSVIVAIEAQPTFLGERPDLLTTIALGQRDGERCLLTCNTHRDRIVSWR